MAKTALLVMELQNDYLWEKRKSKFPYDTEKLIAAVNDAISRVRADGGDVIYLKQIFPDTPSNHIIFAGCSVFCVYGRAGLYGNSALRHRRGGQHCGNGKGRAEIRRCCHNPEGCDCEPLPDGQTCAASHRTQNARYPVSVRDVRSRK